MNPAPEVWKKALALMEGTEEGKLAPTTISTWFSEVEALSLETDRLVLYTPTDWVRDSIVQRYLPNIQRAMRELFSSDFEITVLTGDEKKNLGREEAAFLPGTEEYTFDKFVVGESNQFAYSAAKAVAEAPEPPKGYNPLFFYGESGLGKTHLLCAIAHAIHAKYPDRHIIYIKGETFTNELIAALQQGKNQEFRQKYRFCDVFLMDDVQFLAGKRSSQEEMFHTFNALFEEGKQIVFTADRPPEEMLQLDERLKTRFSSGLPVDIHPPDYETRVAIIKNKAIRRGMTLPDPVLRYIAENITANVRQIEGTVNKILAFQELMGEEVNVDTVTRAVRDMFKNKTEFLPSTDAIIEEVGKFYNLSPKDIQGQTRTKDVALARQIAMYEIRRMTNLSLKEIGQAFEGRDHTTVMHSIKQVEAMIKESPEMAEIIKDINANINARYE